jgi:hypothetical protein
LTVLLKASNSDQLVAVYLVDLMALNLDLLTEYYSALHLEKKVEELVDLLADGMVVLLDALQVESMVDRLVGVMAYGMVGLKVLI